MKISPPLKVGILTLVSTCILIFGIMWLKGRSISIGEKIEVHFKDVDGMRAGSGVQMMGMRIGQVDEVVPHIDGENSYIIVKFVISEPNVTIPLASKVSVQQSGIIGEKFLEITPPFPRTALIKLERDFKGTIKENAPVKILLGDKYRTIGSVKEAEIITINSRRIYKVKYVNNMAGLEVPFNSKETLYKTEKGDYVLRIVPPENVKVKVPDTGVKYTVVEPLRIKDFLDVQMEAALALKETNDKINNLFTDQFMDDVRFTFENTKDLSEKAAFIVDQVSIILDSSKEDIEKLIASSIDLSKNMTELAANLNSILGDSQFKENLIATTDSIRITSEEFSQMLQNSKLDETMQNINSTSNDVSEIAKYLNELTKDSEFNNKVEETVLNLNDLMVKLSKTAVSLEELTVEEKETIKEIISNSHEASEDLKKFSNKLNKRFLLLRFLL